MCVTHHVEMGLASLFFEGVTATVSSDNFVSSHYSVGACSQANRFDDDLLWVQGFALSHCVMLRTLYYRAFGTGVITWTASLPDI